MIKRGLSALIYRLGFTKYLPERQLLNFTFIVYHSYCSVSTIGADSHKNSISTLRSRESSTYCSLFSDPTLDWDISGLCSLVHLQQTPKSRKRTCYSIWDLEFLKRPSGLELDVWKWNLRMCIFLQSKLLHINSSEI